MGRKGRNKEGRRMRTREEKEEWKEEVLVGDKDENEAKEEEWKEGRNQGIGKKRG